MPLERFAEVTEAVARALKAGRQVYWVCPLVEESESIDVAAAEERCTMLRQRFGAAVDLVHGRMRGPDKDRAMERFAKGETRLLVATTVIEVGVDVPQASVMVIEHAERFGLAQLHQLRGRIGRGAERSSCILLYKAPLGPTAKARLAILRETDDGFRIAEEDLRLRGQGDVLGVRQSGMPGFAHRADRCARRFVAGGARRRGAGAGARSETAIAARGGVAAIALSVRARRGGPHDRRGLTPSYFAVVGSALRAVCAARAVSASAASLACDPGDWDSPPGCTMPADINSVIAASTVMSRSITSRRGT